MKYKKLNTVIFLLLNICFFNNFAVAQEAGDNIVSIGAVYLSFDSSVGALTSTGNSAAEAGAFNAVNNVLGTTSVKAKNTTAVTISLLHMFTNNFGGEIVLGAPPAVKLNLNIPGAKIAYAGALPTEYNNGASSKASTPAILIKYLFNDPVDSIRPYLGFGVSYAWFSDPKFVDALLLKTLAGGGAKLSSSWNTISTIGVTYNIDSKISVSASTSYLPLKTNAKLISGSGVTSTVGNVNLKPTIFNFAIGYKF